MASTTGRRVVVPLVNKSGGGVIAGDVVIIDTANDDAFTTTTSAAFTGTVGIAQETIANNATGQVLLSGEAALVNVSASVTRGYYGATHTVAKQAASAGASRGVGTFCQFKTGGATPKAIIFPVDLLGSSLTNPMTTAGDMIVGGASGAPARLAAGLVGTLLTGAGAGVAPTWSVGKFMGFSVKQETPGTAIGTGATDIAGATLTIVPAVVEDWIVVAVYDFDWTVASAGNLAIGDINFSGTGSSSVPSAVYGGAAVNRATVTQVGKVTGVSAASHTIKMTALKTGAGGTLQTSGVSTLLVVRFSA